MNMSTERCLPVVQLDHKRSHCGVKLDVGVRSVAVHGCSSLLHQARTGKGREKRGEVQEKDQKIQTGISTKPTIFNLSREIGTKN
jgi:hypothetical protein